MLTTTRQSSSRRRRLSAAGAALALLACVLSTASAAVDPWAATAETHPALLAEAADEGSGHLLVSEVMTGGASASDEFIELYNPGPATLPLEGLEVVYVSASGLTVTRKASWEAGAPTLAPGAHLLIANEAGIFASLGDAIYANGLAATGGSVAIRVIGAATAVDAVGWGTAASGWMEGAPAPAAPAGSSIERLPGGSLGSGQDTDANLVDFVVRATPEPQNAASSPIPVPTAGPSASPTAIPTASPTTGPGDPTTSPTPTGSASPTASQDPTATAAPTQAATPTAVPTPSPSQAPLLTVADARAQPDGTTVMVEGVTLTDGLFADGGGYLADPTGGVAVLVADGTFPRGVLLRVTGTVDDRFHQRTIRTETVGLELIGPAPEGQPLTVATGEVGESLEGRLVAVHGTIGGAPTVLAAGLAFDLDDGSGPLRVVVGSGTGIDSTSWESGASIQLRGVVGQRDSTGSGTAGYRLQPRDAADVTAVASSPSPASTDSPTSSPASQTPDASQPGDPSVVSIAAARSAPSGARLTVSGVVTLPSGLSEPGSAVLQDPSGAILLRLGDEAGELRRGQLVRVQGTRSTWSGMLSLRVSEPPVPLGTQAEPEPSRRTTGGIGEADEAALVIVRGLVSAAPRRTSAQNTYLDLDDGSGPLRVFLSPRARVSGGGLVKGAWIEVTGVITQETSGKQPERGYRLWPRTADDVRVVASPTGVGGGGSSTPGAGRGPSGIAGPAGAGGQPVGPPGARPSVPAPRLALALPTASAPPEAAQAVPAIASVRVQANHGHLAAALLLAAALALSAAAWLIVDPGLPERVRAALVARARPEPDLDEAAGTQMPDPPGLVTLTVLDGLGGADRASRGQPPPSRG